MKRTCTLFALVGLTLILSWPTAATSSDAEGPPILPDDLERGWYAHIETSMGTILARLLPEQAPQSVAHFAALAEGRLEWFDAVSGETEKGRYYDGIQVHRAEAGQRFEAGDRHGTGRGAPELYVPLEGLGPVNFSRPGRLGMTRAGGGRLSGVQFFITAGAVNWYTGAHPCFGEVIEGHEAIFNITQVKTFSNGRPIDPITIERVRIVPVGEPDALPEPIPYRPRPAKLQMREDKAKALITPGKGDR